MGYLESRVCVVTGAGSGIGAAIAERFAKEGGVVAVNDYNLADAEETARRCRAAGSESVAVQADVSDSAAVNAMFAEVVDRFGRVDVLVNNAGIAGGGGRVDISGAGIANLGDDEWHRMLAVHLDGNFFCTRAAVPVMANAGRGSIVCISSVAALCGIGAVHYAAAKGGILGMVRALAVDLGPIGIRINAVCPGLIDTQMVRNASAEFVGRMAERMPIGRLGDVAEIASAVLHLASDESSYTTGQWLSPNGGLVIS